jgi:hypothetical protein
MIETHLEDGREGAAEALSSPRSNVDAEDPRAAPG